MEDRKTYRKLQQEKLERQREARVKQEAEKLEGLYFTQNKALKERLIRRGFKVVGMTGGTLVPLTGLKKYFFKGDASIVKKKADEILAELDEETQERQREIEDQKRQELADGEGIKEPIKKRGRPRKEVSV